MIIEFRYWGLDISSLSSTIYSLYVDDLEESDKHYFRLGDRLSVLGYPLGLYDEKNKLPLSKSGYISSEPYLDFQGKNIFLIDGVCFPGMSGSPVFTYSKKTTQIENGYNLDDEGSMIFRGIFSSVIQSKTEIPVIGNNEGDAHIKVYNDIFGCVYKPNLIKKLLE